MGIQIKPISFNIKIINFLIKIKYETPIESFNVLELQKKKAGVKNKRTLEITAILWLNNFSQIKKRNTIAKEEIKGVIKLIQKLFSGKKKK